MDWLEGLTPASPIPTPILASASVAKLLAAPQRAVMIEKVAREAVIIPFLPRLSASMARGTPRIE